MVRYTVRNVGPFGERVGQGLYVSTLLPNPQSNYVRYRGVESGDGVVQKIITVQESGTYFIEANGYAHNEDTHDARYNLSVGIPTGTSRVMFGPNEFHSLAREECLNAGDTIKLTFAQTGGNAPSSMNQLSYNVIGAKGACGYYPISQ